MDLLSKFLEARAGRLRYPRFDGLKVLFVERGSFFCRPAPAEPWIPLASGDVLVLARPADYVFATDPEAPVREAPATPYVVNEGLADRAVVYA